MDLDETFVEQLTNGTAVDPGESLLSTNVLLCQPYENTQAVSCLSPAVNFIFSTVLNNLITAARFGEEAPRQIVAAKRLVNGLAHCLGSIGEYNKWAALDHRSTSFLSLRHLLEGANSSDFRGPWASFGETSWASLRYDLWIK
jgi:hypothetical protein